MKKYLFSLLPVFLLVLGCVPNAQENKLHHQTELQYDLWKEDSTPIEQVFSLREDTVTTIVCEGGTKLIIPLGAFVLEENPGKPLQGAVELRVLEVYQPAEMLRHHLTTQEKSGKLLESAGMIFLTATAGRKELRLKEGREILLGFPKKEKFEGAALFRGTGIVGDPLRWEKEESKFDLKKAIIDTYFGGDSAVNIRIMTAEEDSRRYSSGAGDTVAIDRSSYRRVLAEDESITDLVSGLVEDYEDYYFFTSPQLGWINCDRFVREEITSLAINISDFPQNTLYYLVFEELNSVMAGYRNAAEPEERNSIFEQVPVGRKANLVVVFNRGGDYYLARQELEIAEGQTIELEPVEMPKEDIVRYMQSLGRAEVVTAAR